MLWILAFHLIFVVCWFSGLLYLPRLFVYHAMAANSESMATFEVMERKLYYAITWPSAIGATLFGCWLLMLEPFYLHQGWLQVKLLLVIVLWAFHLVCGHYRKRLLVNPKQHNHVFYRWFNEIPSVLLIVVVCLAVVKPF